MPNLTDYTLDTHNANLGTVRGHEELTKSIQQLGLGRSILTDKDGRIIAGNKTYTTAVQEGISKVVEVETTGDTLVVVKRTDLDLNEHIKARVLAHADNKIGQDNLNFDPAIVKADLELLQSDFLDELWTPDDLGELFSSPNERPQESEEIPDGFKQYSEEILCDYRCPKCYYEWNGKPK